MEEAFQLLESSWIFASNNLTHLSILSTSFFEWIRPWIVLLRSNFSLFAKIVCIIVPYDSHGGMIVLSEIFSDKRKNVLAELRNRFCFCHVNLFSLRGNEQWPKQERTWKETQPRLSYLLRSWTTNKQSREQTKKDQRQTKHSPQYSFLHSSQEES